MINRMLMKLRRICNEVRIIAKAVRVEGPVAKMDTGKSVSSQLLEIISLRQGPGKLTADEYYEYGLYDDRRHSWVAKQQFFGRQMEDILVGELNARPWVAIANDKLITQALLERLGFPLPRIYAVYDEVRYFGSVPCFSQPQDLGRFIRDGIGYPFVSKPIWGMYSRDLTVVMSLDRSIDLLSLYDGDKIRVEDFVATRVAMNTKRLFSKRGYLFQELLQPHPAIADVCGERTCTVRILVNLYDDGPKVFRSLWKVATGTNMADNFWRPGNIIGTVDLHTGRVDGFVQGCGRNRKEVTVHPDTGKLLTRFVLPHWDDTVRLCRTAAAALPGLRMQAWDIAICPDGPVLVEVNIVGGLNISQLAAASGIYDLELRDFLSRYGSK